MKTLKLIGKVALVFLVWISLGGLFRLAMPEVGERYGFGKLVVTEGGMKPEDYYGGTIKNLTELGFYVEREVKVATKTETYFGGTFGNISEVRIVVSLRKPSSSAEGQMLSIFARYSRPRWKNGGAADHLILKNKLQQLLKE